MPRHGIGIDISTLAGSEGVVTTIDDFVFESFSAGQMHPMLTTSRTNLAEYSENFTNGTFWTFQGVTQIDNSIISPDSTQNADKFYPSATGSFKGIFKSFGSSLNATAYNVSAFVKKGGKDFFLFYSIGSPQGSNGCWFNLNTGVIGHIGAAYRNVKIDNVGNDWFRCSATLDYGGTGDYVYFLMSDADNNTTATVDGTDGIYLWGIQIEQDSFASAYIPTSGSTVTVATTLNDTSEVWDFDGTDIMIAEDPEDEGFWEESYPDGATLPELVLNGDYEELGSELITNSDFATDSDWNKGTGWTIANGKASSAGSNEDAYLSQNNTLPTTGKTYKVTFDVNDYTSGTLSVRAINEASALAVTSTGSYEVYITPISNISIGFRSAGGGYIGSLDNVSIKQVDPNNRWTLGTNWSIEDGKAVGAATTTNLQQLSILEVGNTYELTFTISDYSAGSVRSNIGGVVGATRSSDGTFTEIATATTTHFYFDGVSAFTGKIDNVSIKEYAIQPLDI